MDEYLIATEALDFDSPSVRSMAEDLTKGLEDNGEKAVILYNYVRDCITYRFFRGIPGLDDIKASATLERGYGFCIPKAVLLTSMARVSGIPSRLHFADLRNHLLPRDLKESLGTDLMVYHGYVELHLYGKWVKANPALDSTLCEKNDFFPVEFTGTEDALFHKKDKSGNQHMEYINDHGTFKDLPLMDIILAFEKIYPYHRKD